MRKLLKQAKMSVRQLLSYGKYYPDSDSLFQQQQLILVNQWKEWRSKELSPLKSIQEAGFRCYSQFEEDGIILYLMTLLGVANGTAVEICCGDGTECMASNLIINHGYKGYLFDGSRVNVHRAREFFKSKKDCLLFQPEIRQRWITAENINNLLHEIGCPKDVDFLSLDLDGNDYWVWKAIDYVRPKVCCFETSNVIPTNLSLTIPYDPKFFCWTQENPEFRSVSLLAMVNISREKGYRLVGSHRHGFNVFFVREDLLSSLIQETTLEKVHFNEWTTYSQKHRWESVKGFPWVEV